MKQLIFHTQSFQTLPQQSSSSSNSEKRRWLSPYYMFSSMETEALSMYMPASIWPADPRCTAGMVHLWNKWFRNSGRMRSGHFEVKGHSSRSLTVWKWQILWKWLKIGHQRNWNNCWILLKNHIFVLLKVVQEQFKGEVAHLQFPEDLCTKNY